MEKEINVKKKVLNVCKILLCIAFLGMLPSCASNGLDYTKDLFESSPDASSALRQIVREHDIIFYGGDAHALANSGEFLKEHMQMLYDEGVRYIFWEGGEPPEDYDAPLFGNFYPWSYTSGGYSRNSVDMVEVINSTKDEKDKIKEIALEKDRKSFPPDSISTGDLYEYRTQCMYDVFKETVKNIAPNEKCLIIAGDLHGSTEEIYTQFTASESFYWKPLGSYLKDEYGDKYFAISFFETLKDKLFFGTDNRPSEWYDIPEEPKFLLPDDMENWTRTLGIDFDAGFDGYIVEKEGRASIPYEYAVFDNEVLENMVLYVEYLDKEIATLNGVYDYNATIPGNYPTYFVVDCYLRGIYYIKLYFGEQFEYDLWNPKTSLQVALDDLKEKSNGNNFVDMVTLNIPNDDGLRDYKERLQVFYEIVCMLESDGDLSFLLGEPTEYIINTQKLIPQDLWTQYLLALMHTKAEFYEEALDYWKELFSEPLVKSMHIYPEALELASVCAKEQGETKLSQRYLTEKEALWNERNIDVSVIELVD